MLITRIDLRMTAEFLSQEFFFDRLEHKETQTFKQLEIVQRFQLSREITGLKRRPTVRQWSQYIMQCC